MACNKLFEYSPYEARVPAEFENTINKNLQLIKDIQLNAGAFSFAFIADNHYHYDNLRAVIDDINKNDEILFVIFGGDIADRGLLKEYMIFYDVMKNLNKPYLTVIGNHDYLVNGETVYSQMFGEYNYSFEFNECKFVIFDDIIWESNKDPDFDWLSMQLADNELYKQVFVIAHIPPFPDQFSEEMVQTYSSLMQENNVQLSMHGHIHTYSFGKVFNDSVNYLTGPWLKEPEYCIINVFDKSFNIELKAL